MQRRVGHFGCTAEVVPCLRWTTIPLCLERKHCSKITLDLHRNLTCGGGIEADEWRAGQVKVVPVTILSNDLLTLHELLN